ncbi:MAG: hypothetical protein E7502_06800 [Ruminococcus sp.]|nr:hypothetical protein [Ruminococcus sp.]
MSKMKKMFAVIAAAAMLCSSMAAMNVGAVGISVDTDRNYIDLGMECVIEKTYGGTEVHISSTPKEFLVITDGTELTQADVAGLANYKGFSEIEWDFFAQTTYKGITLEPEKKLYRVWFSSAEELAETARSFALSQDFVEDVYFTRDHQYLGCTFEDALRFSVRDADFVPDAEDFPEIKLFTEGNVQPQLFPEEHTVWKAVVTEEYMAGCESTDSYDIYLHLLELADRIAAEYSDDFIRVTPYPTSVNFAGPRNTSTQSIWNNAGDSNADGKVDASDAASVLTIAAQNGTGAGIKATAADDVNADGNVDASDAAAVLSYAAAKGTGMDVTWVDILRR